MNMTQFSGNFIVETHKTVSLDQQGIYGLMAAMSGEDCPDTDTYGRTDLNFGYRLGTQLRANGFVFVGDELEEVDCHREPRFVAIATRLV